MKESLLVETLTLAEKAYFQTEGDVIMIAVASQPPSRGAPKFLASATRNGTAVETAIDGPLVENAINALFNQIRWTTGVQL